MDGFTLVWSGTAQESFKAWKPWGNIPEGFVITAEHEDGIGIWIANEHINWVHFRKNGEYVPATVNMTRSRLSR